MAASKMPQDARRFAVTGKQRVKNSGKRESKAAILVLAGGPGKRALSSSPTPETMVAAI